MRTPPLAAAFRPPRSTMKTQHQGAQTLLLWVNNVMGPIAFKAPPTLQGGGACWGDLSIPSSDLHTECCTYFTLLLLVSHFVRQHPQRLHQLQRRTQTKRPRQHPRDHQEVLLDPVPLTHQMGTLAGQSSSKHISSAVLRNLMELLV